MNARAEENELPSEKKHQTRDQAEGGWQEANNG